jgi:hypothetical protein
VVGLVDKYDASHLNAACRKALVAGDPSYKTVKGILAAGIELDEEQEDQAPPAAAAHLHGPQRLFDIGEAAR